MEPNDEAPTYERPAIDDTVTKSFTRATADRSRPEPVTSGSGTYLPPGSTIDEFDIIERLGKGAFATVYLAHQRSMERLVALKVATTRGREAQTLAQLDHPNIVRVYDQRETDDGRQLMYVEYVRGGTLRDVIRGVRNTPPAGRDATLAITAVRDALERRGNEALEPRPPLNETTWPQMVCSLGARVAEALHDAHEQGVLHRDVKPSNVLLDINGNPKLADFNVSSVGNDDPANLGGTLPYMSPEQLGAFISFDRDHLDQVDRRSDIYSLGVVLWELLHGARPFQDGKDDDAAVLFGRRTEMRPARPVNASTGTGLEPLEAVLLRCVDPDPSKRYPNADVVARELRLCLRPDTLKLLRPPSGWRRIANRHPVVATILVALVPNVAVSAFNYAYNKVEIVAHTTPESLEAFWNLQAVINAIAYPAGLVLCIYFSLPILRAVMKVQRGIELSGDDVDTLMISTVRMGHRLAMVILSLWVVAGIAYPLALDFIAGPLSMDTYLHFAASLALCGGAAAAYPFFLITSLSMGLFVPSFIRASTDRIHIRAGVQGMDTLASAYLMVAATIPVLAAALLMASGSRSQLALTALSVAGVAGFGMCFALYRSLHRDREALLEGARMDAVRAIRSS